MLEFLDTLTHDEQQLLKDTINHGSWGECSMEFLNEAGEKEWDAAYAYCSLDAMRAAHFSSRQIAAMFRRIYKKLCPVDHTGRHMSQCSDWFGEGSGDLIFFRLSRRKAIEAWAKRIII